ncbi:MAG: glycosyltransferase family 4 protein [Planctomycetes bacterium]|nr:glycosyltransferase family 4 protein [Planctomycetota bacterium]
MNANDIPKPVAGTSSVQSHTTGCTLIVSWHWPPTKRASTQVLANLFAGASADGYVVLTRAMDESNNADAIIPPSLPTQRVNWPAKNDEDGRIATWIASLLTTFRMWRQASRCAGSNPIERVFAVYPHRYGLLAGWLIAKKLRKPLTVYMHDLFAETLIARNKAKRGFWTWLDRRVMKDASLVIVPTREFAQHYERRGVGQTWVLPHCIAKSDSPVPMPKFEGELRLAYAGSIYQAHEDSIAIFLTGIDGASNVSATFLSEPHRLLSGRDVQWLSRSEARHRMADSHVLVVALGHNTPYPQEIDGCFPSKIVDYLSIGRPILAIVPPGCFVDRFIAESGCGLSVTSQDPADVLAAVEQLSDADCLARFAESARAAAVKLGAGYWIAELTRELAGVGSQSAKTVRGDLATG